MSVERTPQSQVASALLIGQCCVDHILGRAIPDWPTLLYLYSRLKPGVTVFDWMARNGVNDLGIDVRRFTSFGVIKVRHNSFAFLMHV